MKLNRNQIKYLVVAAMLIDHIAWAFVKTATPLGQVMHFIGRLTGPTMAYFLYEGYIHTRDVKKYALRLGVFALISWVPYSLFEIGAWPSTQFGVIYTLLLGLLAMWIWDKAAVQPTVKIVLIAMLIYLSGYGDWPYFDVLWPLLLLMNRDSEKNQWLSFWAICALAVVILMSHRKVLWTGAFQLGIFMVPLLLKYCYNGEPGSRKPFHKWFFYVFYPTHLLVLAYLKWFV